MEIEAGYKKTELGIIPMDWDVKKIVDVVDVDNDNLNSSTNPEYHFNYISLEDVDNGRLRNISELVFKNAPSRARRKVKKEDILVSTVRPNLKSHLLLNEEVSDWICSTGFSVLRSKNKSTNTGFLFHHFFASIINEQIENLITGSNYPAISSKDVKSLQIPFPPTLKEQTAIATALSDADALITSLEKLIEKKRGIKQGAMQELLMPKLGWMVKKLGEECDLITKGTTPTSIGMSFQESGINFIKLESLTPIGEIIKDKVAYIDSNTHSLLKRSQLRSNDILISIAGALGRIAIVNTEILPANTNQALAISRLKNEAQIDVKYLFFILNTVRMQNYILSISVQGAQPNLSLQNIYDLPIEFPPIKEQQRIATILYDMDAEIAALDQKLSKYKMLKQGMMQELLTGKIRLV